MRHDPLQSLGVVEDPRFVAPSKLVAGDATVAASVNPATGKALGGVRLQTRAEYDRAIERTRACFLHWRTVPAPVRGEIVRRIGEAFRAHKDDLGALVTLEMGKIFAEGRGEVQECIDIADFAVGLSRQLYGLTIASERREHRMMEQWHPLGPVGVITAFNFPIAVWAWNAMLAAVCGDTVVWKPSLITPLVAVAGTRIVHRVMREQDLFRAPAGAEWDPTDVFPLVVGTDAEVGEAMIADGRLPLISATGSCRMGKRVGQVVAGRLGRALLELGGNNAIIVMPDADMELTRRAVVFGAVGSAGQRCTTTRRLICVGDARRRLLPLLESAYRNVKIGDPMAEGTLMGPLIDERAVRGMAGAIERATAEGCRVVCGGLPGIERFKGGGGWFVEPTILEVPRGVVPAVTREETFAPVLYVFEAGSLEEAIALQNDVPQGLSSAIFTDSARAAERFLSPAGSDCGIANVNLGTSGAEIGGAFGGEKETGGGRESGSDSWKAYMRRQTNTVNYGADLPLAQGIRFE
ncbi:MAG: aldehyde dehydrogenase family protein [Planctomycetota bacterium]|nr:aldehyde dehydrogenase family protein [Planctomycetota bacterium]